MRLRGIAEPIGRPFITVFRLPGGVIGGVRASKTGSVAETPPRDSVSFLLSTHLMTTDTTIMTSGMTAHAITRGDILAVGAATTSVALTMMLTSEVMRPAEGTRAKSPRRSN